MDNIFGANDTMKQAADTNVGGNITTEERKQKIEAIKSAYAQEVSSNPNFSEIAGRLRSSVQMVHTLGYGTDGNIIVDKEASTYDENGKIKDRKLATTSRIVGYMFKNIGNEAIPYTTEVYTKNAEGVYVAEVVDKQLNPGETICLNRKYTTLFMTRPELGLECSNGKMIESSKKKSNSVDDILTGYYFAFDKSLNLDVNSDEIKLSVGAGREIKPEYIETFGWLCNEAPAKERTTGTKGKKADASTMAACYIRKLLKENGQA